MAAYRLYCFAQSGNAYKVALMLQLCGVEWEPRFVDFFNGETRTDAFRRINPMGEVPILEQGEMRMTQSGVILDYLAGETGRFGARTMDEGREILRWLFWDNHKLTSYAATYRFLINFTNSGTTPVTQFLEQRMRLALDVLEAQLARHAFVAGDAPTIADLSACGYLYFEQELGVSWSEYPNIGRWLDRIRALDGWAHPYDLMPGHPLSTEA